MNETMNLCEKIEQDVTTLVDNLDFMNTIASQYSKTKHGKMLEAQDRLALLRTIQIAQISKEELRKKRREIAKLCLIILFQESMLKDGEKNGH